MASKTPITAEQLRKLTHYDPATGIFTRTRNGKVAGAPHSEGYWVITLGRGRWYYAHRLAWFYMTGEWPPQEIDHRDGNRSNNRWENLRLANKIQNQGNRSLNRNNTSGHRGVSFLARTRKWKAVITIGGKPAHLGYFHEKEDAIEAYRRAAVEYFGEFARAA